MCILCVGMVLHSIVWLYEECTESLKQTSMSCHCYKVLASKAWHLSANILEGTDVLFHLFVCFSVELPVQSQALMEDEVAAADEATAMAYMSPSEDTAGMIAKDVRKKELERQRSEILSGDEKSAVGSPVGSPPSFGSPPRSGTVTSPVL